MRRFLRLFIIPLNIYLSGRKTWITNWFTTLNYNKLILICQKSLQAKMMSAFKNVVCILFTYFLILSTLFILCGQVVNKLSSVDKFILFSIFDNSLFYKGLWGYLPQRCLYFFPEPHGFLLCTILLHFRAFYPLILHFNALCYTWLHSAFIAESI